uniref:Small ribosomal subunit protein uS9c n=1 Tax=Trebouxia lynnae TaxID=1825957 RepID=A0A6B9VNI7_9CHLO|nr:ribosomal protein S9 [Trebouxia lynnae]QHO63903.1 ribosomal protein S9 [Trebouxia lynnae]
MSEKFPIIATGRRKTAVAQVQLFKGSGEFTINGKAGVTYLQKNASSILCVKAPFNLLNLEKKYDLIVKVKGGGFLGQAEAIQLGISRALCDVEEMYRGALKQKGFLRRDSRSKERKKYGLKKARKAPQYSKR